MKKLEDCSGEELVNMAYLLNSLGLTFSQGMERLVDHYKECQGCIHTTVQILRGLK